VHEIGEQVELVLENPRCFGHRGLRRHAAVGPQLEHEPLLWSFRRGLALDAEVRPLDGCEVRIDQHRVDRERLGLTLLGGLVPAPALHAHFHLERPVLVQRRQGHIGRQDLDVCVRIEGPGCHRGRSLGAKSEQLGPIHVQDEDELAQVRDDVERVFVHPLKMGELVEDSLDLRPRRGGPGNG
jgi:hypothetical protein